MKNIYRYTLLCVVVASVYSIQGCSGWNPEKKSETEAKVKETVTAFKKKDSSMKKFFNNAYA